MKTKLFLIGMLAIIGLSVNAQWAQVNNGLTITNVYSLATNGTDVFAGTDQGVYMTSNNGGLWSFTTVMNDGLSNYYKIYALATSGTNIFAGVDAGDLYSNGSVFLSTNKGGYWFASDNGMPYVLIDRFAVKGATIFAGTGNMYGSIYVSTNSGSTWALASNGLNAAALTSIAISGTNTFVGMSSAGVGSYGGVFLSNNNGTSWTAAGLANINVSSLAVSGANIFAGTDQGVYVSSNNGNSWTQVNNGLVHDTITALAVSGTNIFAGAVYGGGIYLSANNGNSWTDISNGFSVSNGDILSVTAFTVTSSYIFASTWRDGVFALPLYNLGVNQINGQLAGINIYPNPSKGIFTIESQTQTSSIEIINVWGEEIYSSKANTVKMQIDLTSQPKGMYFYKIISKDGCISTGKWIVQ